MGKQENKEEKNQLRWFVPLLVMIPFVIWDLSAFGFTDFTLIRAVMAFMALFIFYNVMISWIKGDPKEKPSATKLIITLPLFLVFMLLFLPPFPYVRPYLVTIITFIIGFESWAFGLGYWFQETKLKRICTGRTIATVIGNVKERMDKRPGEISTYTFYPILAYTVNGKHLERQYEHGLLRPKEVDSRIEICYNPDKPEEFCFLNQKENTALTFGVPFILILGTCSLIAAVITI